MKRLIIKSPAALRPVKKINDPLGGSLNGLGVGNTHSIEGDDASFVDFYAEITDFLGIDAIE